MKRGFTLIEIMIAFAILTGIVVGVAAIYGNLAGLHRFQKEEAERNTDISITCKMIKKDIEMAGFATPDIIRFASDNGTITSDTLFIADGWEIMTDYTDNGNEDGTIDETLYGILSRRALGGEGYVASLRNHAGTGATAIEISDCNITQGAIWNDQDFKQNTSLIISGNPGIRGYRIMNIDYSLGSITIQGELPGHFSSENTIVVPAICYYIQNNWLYRNSARVIEDVVNLQVEYGYDEWEGRSDRIITDREWRDQLPSGHNPRLLRAIRIHLAIRPDSRIPKVATYTIASELRN